MKSNRSILYKQKKVILTIVDGVLHLVCAVYLRYTLLKFTLLLKVLLSFNIYLAVMYIKTKSVHFDAMTITVVLLGKFVLFSYGKVKDIFVGIRIKFHLGMTKGKGYEGEAQNEGYFCKIPIIQQDINFISQTYGKTNF